MRDKIPQRNSVEVLHREKSIAAFYIRVINGADIWMVQRRSSLCFSLEPLYRQSVLSHVADQKLQRDYPVQTDILRLIHFPHPPAAEPFQNTVVRDGLADE